MPKSRVRKGRKEYRGGRMSKGELRDLSRRTGAPIMTVSECWKCEQTFAYFNDATVLPSCPDCGSSWW